VRKIQKKKERTIQTQNCIKQKKRWFVFLNLLSFSLFVLIFLQVFVYESLPRSDQWVSLYMNTLQTESMTEKVIFVTDLNGVIASSIVFVAMALFLWYKKWYSEFKFWLFAFGGATLLFNAFKFGMQRARPEVRLIDLSTYSFPSGHSTMAMVLSLGLYFIFVQRVKKEWLRSLLLLICIVWPLAIAATRLYLNVHWLSDVIGGLLLGFFWVTLMVLLYPPVNNAERKEQAYYK